MNHLDIGNKGEQVAAHYLSQLGYKIITTKYRAKTGEIDIIAKERDCLVFVEVKTRRSAAYGFPAEAVTLRKQQKIINTALCFLAQRNLHDAACRFDILEVYVTQTDVRCNHIKNAFGN